MKLRKIFALSAISDFASSVLAMCLPSDERREKDELEIIGDSNDRDNPDKEPPNKDIFLPPFI